jgi:hypothetical protein
MVDKLGIFANILFVGLDKCTPCTMKRHEIAI